MLNTIGLVDNEYEEGSFKALVGRLNGVLSRTGSSKAEHQSGCTFDVSSGTFKNT